MIQISIADIRGRQENGYIPEQVKKMLSSRVQGRIGRKAALESSVAELLLLRVLRNRVSGQDPAAERQSSGILGQDPAAERQSSDISGRDSAASSLPSGISKRDPAAVRQSSGIPVPLRIAERQDGKPYLADCPDLHYNLSHSGGLVLCALGDEEVGADVQIWQPDRIGLAEKICTAEERQALRAAEDPVRAFFDLWTAKEAYLKYLGTGIRRRMNSFRVEKDMVIDRDGPPEKIHIRQLTLIRGFSAAVCAKNARTAEMEAVYSDHPEDFRPSGLPCAGLGRVVSLTR